MPYRLSHGSLEVHRAHSQLWRDPAEHIAADTAASSSTSTPHIHEGFRVPEVNTPEQHL